MRPDGSYLQTANAPVRFTFAPEAGRQRGVEMDHFKLWVKQGSTVVAEELVQSSVPAVELPLPAGRYSWHVQWWSKTGQTSLVRESEVVVPDSSDIWDGIPWLGANDKNEFMADVNLGGSAEDQVELLVATLGFGYVQINDQEISKDVLSYSGWTRIDKRVLYRSYDVTSLLNASKGGKLFVSLGCGYRCDPENRFPAYSDSVDRSMDTVPKVLRLQLRLKSQSSGPAFHSGSPGWMARQGPVTEDSVYNGVTFIPAATGPWGPATALAAGSGPQGQMVPATFPGVQVTREDLAVKITQPSPGLYVVDFGTNVAGVCSISIPGPATVTLRHGEILQHAQMPQVKNPDPNRIWFGNLRSATANDTVVVTSALNDWWPRFTYHGFRYVEVSGYPGTLTQDNIKRLVLHTALEDKASVSFDDEVLQAIHIGSKGAQQSNLMQVPTDCPQRDERLGWMGDAALSASSMLLHFHYAPMASAYVDSIADELGSDGTLPDVVPFQRYGGRPGDLSWSAAFLDLVYGLWKEDGLLTPAANHWADIKLHVSDLRRQYKNAGNLSHLPPHYGDWCPPPVNGVQEHPGGSFTPAFSLTRGVGQAAELGKALGGSAAQDAEAMQTWYSNLVQEFHQSFYNADKQTYDKGVMINYVLPLALGSVPDSEKTAFVQGLLQYIAAHNNTWTGGIINNRFLFEVLADNGAIDLAWTMLKRKEYPSYGYMYFNDLEPATENMWELPDAPFEGDGMNSRNHHMFSSVGQFLVTHGAGLSLDMPSNEVRAVVGSLEGASASIVTAFGAAHFRWSRSTSTQPHNIDAEITVPIGMTAQVFLPLAAGAINLIGGNGVAALRTSLGVKSVHETVQHQGSTFTVVTVGSGHYRFVNAQEIPAVSASPPSTVIFE